MIVLALLAAAGIALFVSGLPIWERSRLERRIGPYLPRGEPSASMWWRWRREPGTFRRGGSRSPGHSGSPDLRLEKFLAGSLGAGAVLLFVVANAASARQIDAPSAVILAGLLFATGYGIRGRIATRQAARRNQELVAALPTALDLLTIAVLSGESIPEAFARVGRAIGGVLGEEFDFVLASIRSGHDTVEALEGLSNRVADPGFARLVDALSTAYARGVPVAEVLRGQADDQRSARRALLLEMGGRREVFMLIPVVFLILPVVVVFALFPGLVTLDLLVP